jgi:hypothetical protein
MSLSGNPQRLPAIPVTVVQPGPALGVSIDLSNRS